MAVWRIEQEAPIRREVHRRGPGRKIDDRGGDAHGSARVQDNTQKTSAGDEHQRSSIAAHMGEVPPAFETGTVAPGPENGREYTSGRPETLET